MIVDSVSPTPFALLRRAKNFEYRDDDIALQAFSAYDDTVATLTDECRRVLECISKVNRTELSANGTSQDQSWSRFEDLGFSGMLGESAEPTNGASSLRDFSGLRTGPRSRTTGGGRPTTPSWADFLSSGFADENNPGGQTTLLAPSNKLPPIGESHRVQSSQSHVRNGLQTEEDLDPGELASITRFDLDDTFWWVWMTSLAGEETAERKAAFGRCTLIETKIPGAKWLVMEEQVKGASAGPEEGAYIAEKKSMFSWTKRGRLGRRKSTGKKPTKEPYNRTSSNTPMSKTSIGPDQHARVQAAAAKLAQGQRDQQAAEQFAERRGRMDDAVSTKTNSVMTLQPHLLSEAGPAMKWDKKFGEGAKDRNALRTQYLGDMNAGRGSQNDLLTAANGSTSALSRHDYDNRDLPALPKSEVDLQNPRYNAAPSPAPPSPGPKASSHQYAEDSSAGPVPPSKHSPLPLTSLDEKPAAQADDLERHPALRQAVPERKAVGPTNPDQRPSVEEAATPEPKKPSPKKLTKKKEGGGGFRKLFGKKKADTAAPAKAEEDPRLRADAVRSVSRLEEHDATPIREPSPPVSIDKPLPARAMSPDLEPSPAVSAISATHREPPLQVGPSPNAHEQHEADQAFSRFDQGPMDDVPAFVPEDSSEDEAAPNVPRRAPPNVPEPSQPSHYDPVTNDDISEESIDLAEQNAVAQDRWAQIRKNAAERAARLSEEQSRRSQSQSARTDEGETSGEETIESRVARIKARVAELTGNMDGQSAQQQPVSGVRRH